MDQPTLGLAPMQGITDAVMRALVSELGGLDYCVTEFLRVTGQPLGIRYLLRACPELAHGCQTQSGTPVHVQLLGSDPSAMAETACQAASLGAKVIDLNFGCPVQRVNRHDGGAALLREPKRLHGIVAHVRQALPQSVALSAKIRLGWQQPDDVVTLAKVVEQAGASWITIHGRTRTQGYSGTADWVRVGLARRAVTIPVVANGDICSPADLARCHELSGCDRFVIGRGLVAKPELIGVLRGTHHWWQPMRRLGLLGQLAQRLLQTSSSEPGIVGRLKGWCALMSAAEPALVPVFESIKRLHTLTDVQTALRAAASDCPNAVGPNAESWSGSLSL